MEPDAGQYSDDSDEDGDYDDDENDIKDENRNDHVGGNSDDEIAEESDDTVLAAPSKSGESIPPRRGWQHLSPVERRVMKRIEHILRESRWKIGDFLSAWTRHGQHRSRLYRLQEATYQHPVLQPIFNREPSDSRLVDILSTRIRREWQEVVVACSRRACRLLLSSS